MFFSVLLTGILAAGVWLRLMMLRMPYWYDEAITVYAINLPWDRLLLHLSGTRDILSPFALLMYRLLLHLGVPVELFRVVNVALGAASLYVGYRIVARAYSRAAGLWFALLTAVSTVLIFYTVELRSYGMLLFVSYCSLYYFITLLTSGSPGRYRRFACFSALMLYVHQFGVAILAVEAALCLAYLRPLKLDKAAWIKSFFAVFLYSVPALWFNLVFKQGTYGVYIGQGLYSADTPGLSELLYVLYLLFNRMIFTYLLAGICILALFQALRPMRGLSFSQWGGRARDWSVSHPAAVTVSAAALLPFAALFFFKAGEISLFVHCTRYVLVSWSLLCFFPAVALAAVRIPAKRLLFGLLALWSVAHAFQLQSHNKGIWYSQYLDKDEESALILADWKDTDLLATPIQGMAYYLDLFTRLKVPLAVITDREYMARNYALRFATHNFIEKELVFSPEDIPAGRRMWVLVCGESFSDPSWRWILTSPGLSILKSYSRKKTQLYLIERK